MTARPLWDADRDGDTPLPEDDAIRAAHPTRTGRHDLYAGAMRLVGARHSKGGLVELVNWLLARHHVAIEEATIEHLTVIKQRDAALAKLAAVEAYQRTMLHRATVAEEERDEARAALAALFAPSMDRPGHLDRGSAPGHGHPSETPGRWDYDGRVCEWCHVWFAAKALAETWGGGSDVE